MQRKMAAGQEAQPPGARSAPRALRLALARAARDLFDLPLAVIGATQARCGQEQLGEHLGAGRMLILLDGPEGRVGALSVDRDSLSAIIQQQTMGQVTGGAPAERPFTGTDAAMVAPLVDAMLKRAAELADILPDKRCLAGYRFGARTEDLRSLLIAVDAERFRLFELTLDFAAGVRQGRWCLALPEPEELPDPEELGAAGPRLDRVAGTARAELSAVIGHLRLPLAELAGMRPGDLLPLHHKQLDRADLVGIDGACIASARLGQIGGMRAVRLNESAPRTPPRGEGQFLAGSLPQPESAAGLTVEMPKMPMANSPGADTAGEGGAMPLDIAAMPAFAGEESEEALPRLSPGQAALEISELAGLPLDGADED